MSATTIELWTDGACIGNPGGPGGWAYVLAAVRESAVYRAVEGSGGVASTTNNRMELQAVIEGLRRLDRPTPVQVFTDSAYVVNPLTQGSLKRWQRYGWNLRKPGKGRPRPVKNADLWRDLLDAAAPHAVTWTRVQGHAGIERNERCDKLATAAASRVRRSKTSSATAHECRTNNGAMVSRAAAQNEPRTPERTEVSEA